MRFSPNLSLSLVPLMLSGQAFAQSVESVDDLNPAGRGSGRYSIVSYAGAFYFAAGAPAMSRELWKYDSNGPSLAADIRPGSGSSDPAELTVNDGTLYFTVDDGSHGEEL